MKENSRIYKFDNLKFFLILMVVIGHTADFVPDWKKITVLALVRTFVYAFHMPLFIFISGLFYKDKNTSVKAFQFFSIGVLMVGLIFIGNIIIKKPGYPNILIVYGVPWYMYAMGFYYILVHLLREVNKKTLLIVSLITALLIGYTAHLGDFLALTRVIVFFPVFLLGTMTDKERLLQLSEKKWLKPVSALIVVGWGLAVYRFRPFLLEIASQFSGKNVYAKLPHYLAPYGIWLRLGIFAVAALLCFAFICLSPNRKLPIISVFGTRTLQVYFWHTPFVFALVQYDIAEKLMTTLAGRLFYLALGGVIVLILSLKPFSFPTNLILKHSKKPEA